MSNSNMYFDPTEFDFDSLTDVIGLNSDTQGRTYSDAEPQPRTTRTIAQNHIDKGTYQPEDLYDENGEIQGYEYDPNEDVSDLITPPEEEHRTALQQFNSLNDDDYLDFGGFEATKGEVKQALADKKRIDQQREAVETAYQSRNDGEEWIKREWLRRTTALERNAEVMRNRMNQARNNTEYGEYRRALDHIEMELRDVHETADRSLKVQAEIRHNEKQAKILFEDQKLESINANWFDKKPQILEYAINELKINPLILEEAYSVGVLQALEESRKYREIVANSRSKAIAAAQPKNARSTRSNPSYTDEVKASMKNKALNQMGSSRQSNVEAFAYLKD